MSAGGSDRPLRRRRSAARTPGLIHPADIPQDAAGRVAFVTVDVPAATVAAPTVPSAEEPAAASEPGRLTPDTRSGWVAVVLLGAILVAAFVVGMNLVR